jgi:hypothetical protein
MGDTENAGFYGASMGQICLISEIGMLVVVAVASETGAVCTPSMGGRDLGATWKHPLWCLASEHQRSDKSCREPI